MNEVPTAAELRQIADWLDTYDRMAQSWLEWLEVEHGATPESLTEALAIVGSTELQDRLRRWATNLDRHQVLVLEPLERDALQEALRDADYYANPAHAMGRAMMKLGSL